MKLSYTFHYGTDEENALAKEHGIKMVRAVGNNGEITIMGDDGENAVPVAHVLSVIDRKRNTPYDVPDPARDETAARLTKSWNEHDNLVAMLRQYRNDMMHPSLDSGQRDRRVEAIDNLIGEPE
tara:strand:- start:111 stop:482 length:372 start_codon:yes stop_codon:yes gene_type:complete